MRPSRLTAWCAWLKRKAFPQLSTKWTLALDPAEREIMDELEKLFRESEQLQRHVTFLYNHGGMYRKFNGNLLFHGCVPLDEDGNLKALHFGGRIYQGKSYRTMQIRLRAALISDDPLQKSSILCGICGVAATRRCPEGVVKTFERTAS